MIIFRKTVVTLLVLTTLPIVWVPGFAGDGTGPRDDGPGRMAITTSTLVAVGPGETFETVACTCRPVPGYELPGNRGAGGSVPARSRATS